MATEYRPIPRLAVGVYPLTNVTPFTYRDGVTYERLLHQLVDRMNTIIGEVNTNNQALFDVVIENMNITIDAVNNALGEQTDEVDQKIADLTEYVDIEVTKIVDMRDEMVEYRDETEAFRNQAELFAANTVALQDAAVAALVATPGSETQTQLNDTIGTLVPITRFGAKGDGVTDNTAAIQSALDSGEPLFVPPGIFLAGNLDVPNGARISGGKRGGSGGLGRSVLRAYGGPLLTPSVYVHSATFEFLTLESTGSGEELITGRWAQSRFENISLTQYHDDHPAINVTGWIDVLTQNASITHTLTATVPTVYGVTSVGELAQSTFQNVRFNNSGDYAVWFEGQNGSVVINFAFRDINFEVPKGGAIKLLSARNCQIENSGLWDFHVSGPATKHLVHIGKSPVSGANSSSITVENLIRDASDEPAAGVMDIKVDAGSSDINVVEARHQLGGTLKVDMGYATGRIIGGRVTAFNDSRTSTGRAPFAGSRTGGRMLLSGHPATAILATSTPTLAVDTWKFMPLTLDRTVRTTHLAVLLGTAATGGTAELTFGLYQADQFGRPSTLVTDFGGGKIDLTTGTGTEKVLNLGGITTIPPGDYFIACAWAGTAITPPAIGSLEGIHASIAGIPVSGTATAWTQAASGAMPPTSPSTSSVPSSGIAIWTVNPT